MYGLFRVNDFEKCLETLSQLTVIVFCDSIFGYTELNLTEVDDPVGTVPYLNLPKVAKNVSFGKSSMFNLAKSGGEKQFWREFVHAGQG